MMNEKLTLDIIDGTVATGAVAGLIGPALGAAGIVAGPVAALIAAATAAAFALKVSEMKIVDDGNEVHWPITWLQWAAVLAAVPTGPAGTLVFIHPVRN